MKIGKDFEKIEFEMFGLELLEPNAFIGDILIAAFSLYAFFQLRHAPVSPFFSHWKRFFLLFVLSFIAGGFGHLMFNYWDVPGKYLSWYLGILSPYFIEQAMGSMHPNERIRTWWMNLSHLKLALSLMGETLVVAFLDLSENPTNGMHVITATTSIGLIASLGFLGRYYQKLFHDGFKYFWWSVLTMIPILVLQLGKISFFQWFDRNDASHLLIIVGIYCYLTGIQAHQAVLQSKVEST